MASTLLKRKPLQLNMNKRDVRKLSKLSRHELTELMLDIMSGKCDSTPDKNATIIDIFADKCYSDGYDNGYDSGHDQASGFSLLSN